MLLTFSTVASDTDLLLYKYVNGRPERARERERPSLTLNQSSQQEEAEKLLVCRLRKKNIGRRCQRASDICIRYRKYEIDKFVEQRVYYFC